MKKVITFALIILSLSCYGQRRMKFLIVDSIQIAGQKITGTQSSDSILDSIKIKEIPMFSSTGVYGGRITSEAGGVMKIATNENITPQSYLSVGAEGTQLSSNGGEIIIQSSANFVQIASTSGGTSNITFGNGNATIVGNTVLQGALYVPTKTVAANYTVLATDYMIVADATTAGFTITMPAAGTSTGRIIVIVTVNTANVVTMSGAPGTLASETSYTYHSDGTVWRRISYP